MNTYGVGLDCEGRKMDNAFRPIPGYEGLYWIDSAGNVLNRSSHYMKPIQTDKGCMVELRKNGQREKVLVRELLIKTMED